MYGAPHAMKKGGMYKGYAEGGMKKSDDKSAVEKALNWLGSQGYSPSDLAAAVGRRLLPVGAALYSDELNSNEAEELRKLRSMPAAAGKKADGGLVGYAAGGPKMPAKREPEAMVRKEVALLRKAGSPKALIQHEMREIRGKRDTPVTKKAEVSMLRKAKAPLTMIREEMAEPVGLKTGGMTKMERKVGKVMGEFKAGDLRSGSKSGPVVKNRKQAIAIGLSEGRKAQGYAKGGQYAAEAPKKMASEGKALSKLAKKYGVETQKYAKGGSVEAKLEKHANMPASKAHGPGAAAKLAKGGVPTFSRVPKFGQMK